MRIFSILFVSVLVLANAHRDNDDAGDLSGTISVREFSAAESQTALVELNQFLSEIPIIRVYIAPAPGNGHQIATINVMKRLRELGYQGHFQIVYGEDRTHTALKLEYLIPGFKSGSKGVQYLNLPRLGSISIMPETTAATHLRQKAVLGISGANDQFPLTSHMDRLNVDIYLQLQPQEWNANMSSEEILFRNGMRKSLTFLNGLNIVTKPIGQPTDFEFEAMSEHPELKEKITGIKTLLKILPEVDLMPAYGITIRNQADHIIRLTILALQNAKSNNAKILNKPILVPVFSEFKSSERNISDVLKELNVPYLPLGELPQHLSELKNQSIAAIQVGKVTPDIFDFIFSKATLPALVEGKNLQNLMLTRGLPYINVLGHLGAAINVGSAAPEIRSQIANAYKGYSNIADSIDRNPSPDILNEITTDPATIEMLSEFIVQSKLQSPLRNFFASRAVIQNTINKDKVAQSLLILKETMASRNLSPFIVRSRCSDQFSN